MQKETISTVIRILKVTIVLLFIICLIEFNAYLDLRVTEKYEIEEVVRFYKDNPDVIKKKTIENHHSQNVRLCIMASSIILGIICVVVKNLLKRAKNSKKPYGKSI